MFDEASKEMRRGFYAVVAEPLERESLVRTLEQRLCASVSSFVEGLLAGIFAACKSAAVETLSRCSLHRETREASLAIRSEAAHIYCKLRSSIERRTTEGVEGYVMRMKTLIVEVEPVTTLVLSGIGHHAKLESALFFQQGTLLEDFRSITSFLGLVEEELRLRENLESRETVERQIFSKEFSERSAITIDEAAALSVLECSRLFEVQRIITGRAKERSILVAEESSSRDDIVRHECDDLGELLSLQYLEHRLLELDRKQLERHLRVRSTMTPTPPRRSASAMSERIASAPVAARRYSKLYTSQKVASEVSAVLCQAATVLITPVPPPSGAPTKRHQFMHW
jgi:hypothetical protein